MLALPRILIVDDNLDHRLILTYQLARMGPIAIDEAGDGQQALTRIAAAPPDLIFMKLGLPTIDGWEAIRRVRALSAPLGQAPIIVLTAYAGGQAEQRARQAGCDEYLVKSMVDRGVLQQTVISLLARSRLSRRRKGAPVTNPCYRSSIWIIWRSYEPSLPSLPANWAFVVQLPKVAKTRAGERKRP